MTKRMLLRDSLGWGFMLWLIGYILGFVFFFVLPPSLIGWAIMPIGIAIALWVLFVRVDGDAIGYYVVLAIVWVLIAAVFDYFFIVKMLHPADGYYKADVYLYYALTFVLPLAAGWYKRSKRSNQN